MVLVVKEMVTKAKKLALPNPNRSLPRVTTIQLPKVTVAQVEEAVQVLLTLNLRNEELIKSLRLSLRPSKVRDLVGPKQKPKRRKAVTRVKKSLEL